MGWFIFGFDFGTCAHVWQAWNEMHFDITLSRVLRLQDLDGSYWTFGGRLLIFIEMMESF